MLDLRYPMGMMFALVGAMLATYGAYTNSSGTNPDNPDAIYRVHSLGLNVNLWWGLALLVFGLLTFGLAHWAAAREKAQGKK
jgi:ABC-type Fe3+-siderophore transport system permease subunit